MHNFTVNATTNGNGPVRWLSLKRIKALDAGYYWTADQGETYPYRGLGILVPTLDETLEKFKYMRMNIEIKGWHPFAAKKLADTFCGILKNHNMIDRVLVASFHQPVLKHIRDQCQSIAISASTFDVLRFVASSRWGSGGYKPGAKAIQTYYGVIDADLVQIAKDMGFKLHGWTVNETDEMRRLIGLGVHGIITDYPSRLLGLVAPPMSGIAPHLRSPVPSPSGPHCFRRRSSLNE